FFGGQLRKLTAAISQDFVGGTVGAADVERIIQKKYRHGTVLERSSILARHRGATGKIVGFRYVHAASNDADRMAMLVFDNVSVIVDIEQLSAGVNFPIFADPLIAALVESCVEAGHNPGSVFGVDTMQPKGETHGRHGGLGTFYLGRSRDKAVGDRIPFPN